MKFGRIDISQQNTKETVSQLEDQLVHAQQARANKIEYEKIGKRIDKLPAREQGEMYVPLFFPPSSLLPTILQRRCIDDSGCRLNQKLLQDIAQLKEEQTTYAATWNSRREAFDSIVQGLTIMSESIRSVFISSSMPCTDRDGTRRQR